MKFKSYIIGEKTGRAYKVARVMLALSLKEVGDETFLSRSTLCHMEAGDIPISGTALYAVWKFYMSKITPEIEVNHILADVLKQIEMHLAVLRGGET